MHDLVIVGAGPGGIALAAEASACDLGSPRAVIFEKGSTHNWAIRQFYPETKLTTANYKGFQARCQGLLCIHDISKMTAAVHEFTSKRIETPPNPSTE